MTEVIDMLNEDRIKAMIKLARYEKGEKKKNIQIADYYRLDYVSLNVIISLLWMTVGYVIVAGGFILLNLETVMIGINEERISTLMVMFFGGLLLCWAIGGIISGTYFLNKYNYAKKEAKKYYQGLNELVRAYKKENKNE